MRRVVQDVAKHRPMPPTGIPTEVVLVMAKAKAMGIEIHLPVDYVTTADTNCIYSPRMGDYEEDVLPSVFEMDCGPKTQALNTIIINASKTIIWNGPIGIYEMSRFEVGTRRLMQDVIEATKQGATSLVIGKHTVRMLHLHNCVEQVTHATSWSWPSFQLFFNDQLVAIDALSDEVSSVFSNQPLTPWLQWVAPCPMTNTVILDRW